MKPNVFLPFHLPRQAGVLGLALAVTALALGVPGSSWAQEERTLLPRVRVDPRVGQLLERWACPPVSIRAATAAVPSTGLVELPSQSSQLFLGARSAGPATASAPPLSSVRPVGRPLRVSFWGDSHLAASFFTDELMSLTGIDPARVATAFIPAGLGHPGVRTLARAACLSEGWSQESAHNVPRAAEQPGPALVSLVTSTPGAEFHLDVRNPGWVPPWGAVRVMMEGPKTPVQLAIGVNDGPLQRVTIQPEDGPMALEVGATVPVSRLRVRLLQGQVRIHGVALPVDATYPLQWDVLAYPGATIDGLAQAKLSALRLWLPTAPPDVVVLGYGTNEGSADPFDAAAYRKTLELAVGRVRRMFPQAACLLIGPADRGVTSAQVAAGADPQRYSRVHAVINTVQAEVALSAGCSHFNALEAMGGPGSASTWLRSEWMTPDLIHFTPKGYQLLARALQDKLNWPPKR